MSVDGSHGIRLTVAPNPFPGFRAPWLLVLYPREPTTLELRGCLYRVRSGVVASTRRCCTMMQD